MPLLQDQQFWPAPSPTTQEIQCLETPDVFYILYTGEILTSYEQYYTKIMLYRSKVWTCVESGRKDLTLKQAFESERKAILKQEVDYPSVWIKATLELIHGSRFPLAELIDSIYDFFRGTRFAGEYIFIDVPTSQADRSVERAIIREKLPDTVPVTIEKKIGDKRRLQRELRESKEDLSRVPEDKFHYLVRLISDPRREFVITPSQIRSCDQGKGGWITLGSQGSYKYNKSNLLLRHNIENKIVAAVSKRPAFLKAPQKQQRFVDLLEYPIEDTELFQEVYILKLDDKLSKALTPVLSFDFGHVSEQFVQPLLRIYNFLYVCGQPLGLYPFKFQDFLLSLQCSDKTLCCDLICEVFSSLLRVACEQYQSKFDVSLGGSHPYYHVLPKADESGKYSSDIVESEIISDVLDEYKSFEIHDRVAVDQWYKWRPGQWGEQSKEVKAKSLITSSENLKAWQVALFGLVKDWYTPSFKKSIKWQVLRKMLPSILDTHLNSGNKNLESKDEHIINEKDDVIFMDADQTRALDDGDDLDMSCDDDNRSVDTEINPIQNGTPHKRQLDYYDEEYELQSEFEDEVSYKKTSRLPRNPNVRNIEEAKNKKIDPKIKKVLPKVQEMLQAEFLFAKLCERIEIGFWSLTADERVELLFFLVDTCIQDSEILRLFQESAAEKANDLRKEQRDISRHRKTMYYNLISATTLTTIGNIGTDTPISHMDLSDGSDPEFEDESRRKSRRTRQSMAKKLQADLEKRRTEAPVLADKDPVELLPEQLLALKNRESLENEDLALMRRQDMMEYENRVAQAGLRLKPLGQDRYCNRYWWFDGALGATSMDLVTSIINTNEIPEPVIPHEFALPYLFKEQCCDASEYLVADKARIETFLPLAIAEIDDLLKCLDRRGIREANLASNIDYYRKLIDANMNKCTEVLYSNQKSLCDSAAADEAACLQLATNGNSDGLFYEDPYLEYENYWFY